MEVLLTFNEWKARYGDTTQAVQPRIYNSSQETLPYDPWFALDHESIRNGIHQLCAPLLDLTIDHDEEDGEIFHFRKTVRSAQVSPPGTPFYIDFLGDQGIGKSSIINALFDRILVNVSSSSSACTAFTTIILHKDGAEDETVESDLRIQYLSDDEIMEHIEEQVRRYRSAYPDKGKSSRTNPPSTESIDQNSR